MRKKIFIGIGLVILIAGAVGFYMFNKKVPSLEHVTPDFELTANELFDAFDMNEVDALKMYENKVIQVTGEVMDVKNTDKQSNIILSAEMAMMGGVNCSFNYQQDIDIPTGTEVVIKGRCQGFLMDVILNNCFLVKK